MSWCVNVESLTFAAIRGVVEKDRIERGGLREFTADNIGDEDAELKHDD